MRIHNRAMPTRVSSVHGYPVPPPKSLPPRRSACGRNIDRLGASTWRFWGVSPTSSPPGRRLRTRRSGGNPFHARIAR